MDKSENKYRLPIGTTRYIVEICDEKEAMRLATIEGWKEGESLFDYIDPIANDARQWKGFKTKGAAAIYAKEHAKRDIFRSPFVEERVLVEEKYGRFTVREWETTSRWILDDGDLVEAA